MRRKTPRLAHSFLALAAIGSLAPCVVAADVRKPKPAPSPAVSSLEGIGKGPVTLVARASGYGPARREGAKRGSRVELFLLPGPALSGSVRDEAGRPVRNATVRVAGDSWSAPPPIDSTDVSGRFTVARIGPGEYVVVAREGGRAPAIEAGVVDARASAEVQLTLSDGGFVTGCVTDMDGRPLAHPPDEGKRPLPQWRRKATRTAPSFWAG